MAYIVRGGSVGDEIGKVLCQQIGIPPESVSRVVLDFRAGGVAMATIEYYLDGSVVSPVVAYLEAAEWKKGVASV